MAYGNRLALALSLLVGCDAAPSHSDPSKPASAQMQRTVVQADASGSATSRPESITPAPTPYERKAWAHWIDADHDCQDTRTEVLIAESYEPVGFEDARKCEVASGRWQCPYTGKIIGEVHLLDVDHLVPLANAHRSGGASWDEDRRRRYANDLEHPEHLVAVDYVANRSKGDKGPEAWLPPSEDYRCTYVREWSAIKQRWGLSMTTVEAAAVDAAISTCDAGQIPELPQARAREPDAKRKTAPKPSETASAQECCRTCKTGKACGDSCIAKTSNCTKPPGCACDG